MAITIDGADNKLEIGANATGPSSLRLYEDTDNGTNYVSIIAPSAVTSNRTITLPDATGTVQVSGNAISGTTGSFSSDLSFNSGYGSAAVAYGCRAWVNFNGTGTVAIRASGNVSSITDNGTGRFTVNFTNAMPDANYAAVCSGGSSGTSAGMGYMYSPTVNGTGAEFVNASDALLDPVYATVSVFR
jgi:uncharacterized protein (AIM24 family)